tara:strand:+ start:39 stop:347 length:309 start_codon:yes stop_codon:yes gene_type:complete
MAFKMKGFSGFKQIEKETPPHNPRTYGVDQERVDNIDKKRDIKLNKMNQGEGDQVAERNVQTPSKNSTMLDTVTVTPIVGMKKEIKKLPPKKILPKPIGRKI